MKNGFKSLSLKYSYSTLAKDNVLSDFLLPALEKTQNYYRSVGFFTVASLSKISNGISNVIKNNGKIKLLCSYVLSIEDIKILEQGYEEKSKLLNNRIVNEFSQIELSSLSLDNKSRLIELIKYSLLDIRIIVKDRYELFHDKVGILEDVYGEKIAFIGSMNDTINAYENNYEKIRIFKSWNKVEYDFIDNEMNEFDSFWNNENPSLESYSIPDAIKKDILRIITESPSSPKDDESKPPTSSGPVADPEPIEKPDPVQTIQLRDYQLKAILNWKNNFFNGFFKMATGTGKTWTAIYSILELFKSKSPIVIVVAPYKHLVEQWSIDIQNTFRNVEIIKVSGDYKTWRNDLTLTVKSCNNNSKKRLIIISTLTSFKLKDFSSIIQLSLREKLLIVDEAHRFESYLGKIDLDFEYKLGLSATPEFFKNQIKTENLINFFNRIVFEYNLDDAISNGHLVNYSYIPHFLTVTEEEQNQYKHFQMRIAGCFKNGILICHRDKLMSLIRMRRSVISKASKKDEKLKMILKSIPEKSNLIIYCGDGKSNFENEEIGLRYIDTITLKLRELDYKVHKFTAQEDTRTRMELIDDFEKNRVDALVAIRCLDEGINIPSIKNALILASTEDPREFIQRRGRILRKGPNKENSTIHDIIMLPFDITGLSILKSELNRYLEYSKLATNNFELLNKLDEILNNYDLKINDLSDEFIEQEIEEEYDNE